MPSVGHVRITGFDRDHGNALNNEKHGVAQAEAEGVFFNQPLRMPEDLRHRDRGPASTPLASIKTAEA